MERFKYFVLLTIKFIVVFLTFFLTAFSTSLQTCIRSGIRMGDKNRGETIVVDTTGNTSLTYATNNVGEIIFDLKNSSSGNASVTFNLENLDFDSTILTEILQDYKDEYAELLETYANGPWECQIKCNLQCTKMLYSGNGRISIVTDQGAYSGQVVGRNNDVYVLSNTFTLEKGSDYSFTLLFDNLEDGKYYFQCDLLVTNLPGLNQSLKEINVDSLKQLSITYRAAKYSFNRIEFKDLFTFYSLLALLTIFAILTIFLFLWRDLAVGWYTFRAIMTGNASTLFQGASLVRLYTNGVYTGEFMDWSGALNNFLFKFIAAITLAGITVMLLMFTAPIRFFVEIIQNIRGIITEDDLVMGFSIIGNIIGPIGLLMFISSTAMIIFPDTLIIGSIIGLVGFILFVLSIILCRVTKKRYYDYYY